MGLLQHLAAETVAPGGPSAPAWAFFTAITLASIGILAQQLKAHSDLKALKEQLKATRDEAKKAVENTANTSNGFANTVQTSLRRIEENQSKMNDAFREHLEWHLEKGER